MSRRHTCAGRGVGGSPHHALGAVGPHRAGDRRCGARCGPGCSGGPGLQAHGTFSKVVMAATCELEQLDGATAGVVHTDFLGAGMAARGELPVCSPRLHWLLPTLRHLQWLLPR